MTDPISYAFGSPGIPPRWTSSAKDGIGAAISSASRVWFTLSHGIFNEIYYPRIDQACTRDMGMIVTDGSSFFSEEKRHAQASTKFIEEAIPAYRIVNTCRQGAYQIEKEIISDPARDAVLQRTKFISRVESAKSLRLHVLLAPHAANCGMGNTAWVGDYKGHPMIFAERNGVAMALAASVPWKGRSVGYVGSSDGWQDLIQHKRLTWQFDRAENGNVAMIGELDWQVEAGAPFTIVVAFGTHSSEAGQRASACLLEDFEAQKERYFDEWREYYANLDGNFDENDRDGSLRKVSAMVLRTHESMRFPGGMIASLSIPWGFNKGDDDLGGYHLVWPRDLVESSGGLLAIGAHTDARRVLKYLMSTQEADGHWPQNTWLDGTPYWHGSQMDETAFPILLVDLAHRESALDDNDLRFYWPMVKRAAQFIVRNGPVTQQDRWEEDPGYSPFTLAVEVSALLAAADIAEANSEPEIAGYLRETADAWNSSIERWTYVSNTELARKLAVEGYYVRIAPPETADGSSPLQGFVPIKNRPAGSSYQRADHIISQDALALVRFGLRAADDPRIVSTVKAIDELLKVETPAGPCWHRYTGDGYGEKEDGSPFDGTGIGRAWPLLGGERGHYEIAAGNSEAASKLLTAMQGFANESGFIPEQVWDTEDIPGRELIFGHPSGSAMPLVWAHAEYLKLQRSLAEGRVFDMPPQTVKRYLEDNVESNLAIWRYNQKCRILHAGQNLRVETLSCASLHWSFDGWQTAQDTQTRDTGLGIHIVDLNTEHLERGQQIDFTFYWVEAGKWEGVDYHVVVVKN